MLAWRTWNTTGLLRIPKCNRLERWLALLYTRLANGSAGSPVHTSAYPSDPRLLTGSLLCGSDRLCSAEPESKGAGPASPMRPATGVESPDPASGISSSELEAPWQVIQACHPSNSHCCPHCACNMGTQRRDTVPWSRKITQNSQCRETESWRES